MPVAGNAACLNIDIILLCLVLFCFWNVLYFLFLICCWSHTHKPFYTYFQFSTESHLIILLSNSGCGGALPQVVMEEGGTCLTVAKYETHRAFVYKRDNEFNPNTNNGESMGYVFKLF